MQKLSLRRQDCYTSQHDATHVLSSPVSTQTGTDASSQQHLDLWSAAYREAFDCLEEDTRQAILKGKKADQLFTQLKSMDKEASDESLLKRSIKHLQSLQQALEDFKLALDRASPISSIGPTTTATVLDAVKSDEATTADVELAKRVGEMLEQISYIDEGDILGQRLVMHRALVSVYGKLIEFNQAASKITEQGTGLLMTLVTENRHPPSIAHELRKQADNLRTKQKDISEILNDIISMFYDNDILQWLHGDKTRWQRQKHAHFQQQQADQACNFLLSDSRFIKWYHAVESQELALIGPMGCGKTMAMSFVVDQLTRRNESEMPQPTVCYHYCQDDKTGQAVDVLSTLIMSLLEQLSGLIETFHQWYKQCRASGYIEPETDPRKLEEFLTQTLEALDGPLFVVIDGLDQCDRASRRLLVQVLRRLLQKCPRLKIMFSTRPEEEILGQLEAVPQIRLPFSPEWDRFIVDKTVEQKLSSLPQDVKTLVKDTLSGLAQGSATWTEMTVELIEDRGIRDLGPMKAFLDNMPRPGKLSELYIKLLSRYTSKDAENQKLAITALEILAVSRRHLSILELAWAVALRTAPGTSTVADLASLTDHSRILKLIQPFIAYIDFSSLRKHQVRLAHPSIKEFVLNELSILGPGLSGWNAAEAGGQTPNRRAAALEASLLDICIRYLSLEEIGSKDLFSEEQVLMLEMPKEVDLFGELDGSAEYDAHCTWEVWEENAIKYDVSERGFGEFFVYASCYWVEHLGAMTPPNLPELKRIEKLCHAGSTRLRNWTMQNSRPQCTVEPRFPFDASLYDPLSIISLYGSPAMLQHMIETSDLTSDSFLPRPAMGAADQVLQWSDLSRVRALFRSGQTGPQLRNFDFFRLVIHRWSPSDQRGAEWDDVFRLLDEVENLLIEERWGYDVFSVAVNRGCQPMVRRLLLRARQMPGLRAELQRGLGQDSGATSLVRSYIDGLVRDGS
ncbi:hypothetical protein E4U42_003931 [Claviceps africana]|uniref:NACHT domain-containing protein n=1 Tax=Claviceps africana TaxID=83212 RepID=A0A8K0J6L6_9HYPO|nr:hypothetical protein E4U42_003931 [Claviceps africana]